MNPSNIYTLSLQIPEVEEGIAEGTLKPKVVIDGRARPMRRSSQGQQIWEYEFTMPPDRTNAVYYYQIDYQKYVLGVNSPRSITIPSDGLLKFSLINRYVVSLAANRGIVGSRIGLNGSGFQPSDQIFVGNVLATSIYYSPNALGFDVPHLAASQNYEVVLRGVRGDISVGSFRVDPAEMQVLPVSVSVLSGERSTLKFSHSNGGSRRRLGHLHNNGHPGKCHSSGGCYSCRQQIHQCRPGRRDSWNWSARYRSRWLFALGSSHRSVQLIPKNFTKRPPFRRRPFFLQVEKASGLFLNSAEIQWNGKTALPV